MLEAVASQDLWIWHAFFGIAGANNDINILDNSPLFDGLLDDKALVAPYVVNGVEFEKGYYLADDQFEEEVVETMMEPTMEEYMTITRINYESGNNEKGRIELKGRFLIELCDNAFSGTNGEDIEANRVDVKEMWDPTSIEGDDDENNGIPWVDEKPWTHNGVWMESMKEEEESRAKHDETIQYEKEPKDDEEIGDLDDYLVSKDAPYYANEEEEQYKERRCKLLGIPYTKPPTYKTKRFEVIKYSFGPTKEYVAIKEYEYNI
ncbi:ALP1-like protein [Tanacetum coccineum]